MNILKILFSFFFYKECTFDAQERDTYTFFGERTGDEMCFAFMELYPRPKNLSTISINNIDDVGFFSIKKYSILRISTLQIDQMNICMWAGDLEGPGQLHGCPDGEKFSDKLKQVIRSTRNDDETTNGLMENCFQDSYPASECTEECHSFLRQNALIEDSCMDDAVFRFVGGFFVSETYSDIYKIQSQVNKCKTTKSGGSSAAAPSPANYSPQENILRYAILLLTEIFRYLNMN